MHEDLNRNSELYGNGLRGFRAGSEPLSVLLPEGRSLDIIRYVVDRLVVERGLGDLDVKQLQDPPDVLRHLGEPLLFAILQHV